MLGRREENVGNEEEGVAEEAREGAAGPVLVKAVVVTVLIGKLALVVVFLSAALAAAVMKEAVAVGAVILASLDTCFNGLSSSQRRGRHDVRRKDLDTKCGGSRGTSFSSDVKRASKG